MRTVRIALAAAALLAGSLVAMPPATAATTNVTVNCNLPSAQTFAVDPGDVIVFSFTGTDCTTVLSGAITSIPGATNDIKFAALVASIANTSGTGGTAVAAWNSGTAASVTYTAGSLSGVDTLNAPTAISASKVRGRALVGRAAQYRMSTVRDMPPPSWLQSYARPAGAGCLAGWNPSWAQWPHGGTGGFVCVRENYYDTSSSSSWSYRWAPLVP